MLFFYYGIGLPQYSARIPTFETSVVFFCLSRDFLMGCLGVSRIVRGVSCHGRGCVCGWLGVCFMRALGRCSPNVRTISVARAIPAAASCASWRKCVSGDPVDGGLCPCTGRCPRRLASTQGGAAWTVISVSFAMIFDCVKVTTVFRPKY